MNREEEGWRHWPFFCCNLILKKKICLKRRDFPKRLIKQWNFILHIKILKT